MGVDNTCWQPIISTPSKLCFAAVKVWNHLDESIKHLPPKTFKNKVKLNILQSYCSWVFNWYLFIYLSIDLFILFLFFIINQLLCSSFYGGPKVSRQFQLHHGNFNFTHGNFNLTTAISTSLTAISIWSRQFQLHSRQFLFDHGNFNFNLTTANSITSRQFFSTFLRTGNSRSDRLEAVEGPWSTSTLLVFLFFIFILSFCSVVFIHFYSFHFILNKIRTLLRGFLDSNSVHEKHILICLLFSGSGFT